MARSRTAGKPRRHGRLKVLEAAIEQVEFLQLLLGIIEIDPGERGREPDVLRGDRFVGAGDSNVGLRAGRARAAFGGVRKILADADDLHREIVAIEPARVGSGHREILEDDIEFRVGQPVGGDRRRLGGVIGSA